jgi:hypothetical protein
MIIYLYKKTHRITGLQYLGKTTSIDPHSYSGSGKYWKSHLKKHGFDYDTEILRECTTSDEVKQWGEYYSTLWNIVDDRNQFGHKTWANLKPESGDGGDPGPAGRSKISKSLTGRKHTSTENEHKSKRQTGIKRSPEYLAKKIGLKYKTQQSRTAPNKNKGRPATAAQAKANAITAAARVGVKQSIVECPHCGKKGGSQTMPRWHFDNCKSLKS